VKGRNVGNDENLRERNKKREDVRERMIKGERNKRKKKEVKCSSVKSLFKSVE
jgi:hypothetical protein